MAGLINTTADNKIWINGIDVTTALIRGSVSDSPAAAGGIVTTTGEIQLKNYTSTGTDCLDIDRTTFPIGSEVIVATELANGNLVRHPRGLLYVMNSTVDVATRTIVIQVGCSLALLAENEESYEVSVDQLWNFVSSNIKLSCDLGLRNLSTLNTALQAEGTAIYQNQYGNIWKVDILAEATNAPAAVVTDKHTALAIAVIDDTQPLAPSSYRVSSTYGFFQPVPPEDEGSATEEGYGDAPRPSDEPTYDGVSRRSRSGSTSSNFGGRWRQFSNLTTSGTGEYEAWLNWDLTVFSGMKYPEDRNDGMWNSWCSWFYQFRPDPLPPAEPSWAYAIETNEVETAKKAYRNEIQTNSTKYFNYQGQEKGSLEEERSTWRTAAGSVIDLVSDRCKQYADYWIEVCSDHLSKINAAYTKRDEYAKYSSAWYYYSCVANHWIGESNSALAYARDWWSYGANLRDLGQQMAWTRATETEQFYGFGGETTKTITTEYENETTTDLYVQALTSDLEKGKVPVQRMFDPKGLVKTSIQTVEYKYNNDGSTIKITKTQDLQNPRNNTVTVEQDAGSGAGDRFRTGSGSPASNASLYDKDGTRQYSTPGEPKTGGLPYPDEWNGRYVDPNTGELLGPVKCPVTVESLDVFAYAPGSNNPSTNPAGWLGQVSGYVKEISFPLSFLGDQIDNVDGVGCTTKQGNWTAAQAALNKYASVYAMVERGADGGFSISENLRPEFYNVRPLSTVDVQLQTIGRGYKCKIDSATWAFDPDSALVNFSVFKVADLDYITIPAEPVYAAPVFPANQETFNGTTPPDTSLAPTWAITDPYSGGATTNDNAPAIPALVNGGGTSVPDGDVPGSDANVAPIIPPSLTLVTNIRLDVRISFAKVVGYSWDYGTYSLPTGLPLDLGTVDTPYPKGYDFTEFQNYVEPAPLP